MTAECGVDCDLRYIRTGLTVAGGDIRGIPGIHVLVLSVLVARVARVSTSKTEGSIEAGSAFTVSCLWENNHYTLAS